MSRLTDFYNSAKVRLPKVADIVTGNINGLAYEYTSANTITVEKGNCYDDEDITPLTLTASQVVSIPTDINEIQHLFLCNDGIVRTDTDIDGVTLLADSVSQVRWVGAVFTDSAGDIIEFYMRGNDMYFKKYNGLDIVTSVNTAFVLLDLSSILPVDRLNTISYGAYALTVDNTSPGFSYDSSVLYTSMPASQYNWARFVVEAISTPVYVKAHLSGRTFNVSVRSISLKR